MKATVQLLLMLLLISSPGFAADSIGGASGKTGNVLLSSCQSTLTMMDDNNKRLNTDQSLDAVDCAAYIAGFLDGYSLGGVNGKPIACPTKDVTVGQTVRIVVKWMKEHPEKLNQPAPACVLAALYSAFPCTPYK